ncbi:hypothetical protein BpJC4_01810 [Weizmannia acidilactici]|uniref:hypothetical protein n=1 Tax=Weizmannia acidilactici TaxID=2607726 RepID=UPI001272A24A|nr:hypothetical protein [Weizmannia acidilactici]GER65710.1 hypothetical protein BpJC4_01810 [Weizmannia acidilactici]
MVKEEETLLFIIDLGRLLDDYRKCPYESVKKSIYEDILLIGCVIHPDHDEIPLGRSEE